MSKDSVDLSCPPIIDPRVWAIAIKRKKKYFRMPDYLGLMTIPPSEAEVVLRAANSKLNKEYDSIAPAGIPKIHSINQAIELFSQNMGVSHAQAKLAIYNAIAWMFVEMPFDFTSTESRADPGDLWRELSELDYPMAAFFLLDIVRSVAAGSRDPDFDLINEMALRYQRLMIQHANDDSFEVVYVKTWGGRSNRKEFVSESSPGKALWIKEEDPRLLEVIMEASQRADDRSQTMFEQDRPALLMATLDLVQRERLFFSRVGRSPWPFTGSYWHEFVKDKPYYRDFEDRPTVDWMQRVRLSSIFSGTMDKLIRDRISGFLFSWPPSRVAD